MPNSATNRFFTGSGLRQAHLLH